ncbi:UNVERIFIED_CONTAM: hypothetical protein Sangu_2355800 [Sesamum angustifolium]|uniref:Uncharacterized protein n=1 Tax=Sesamum angustifolium TaxID=2727405 RepID=A0AAW2KWJ1_9LAMI
MAKRRARKNTTQPASSKNNVHEDGVSVDNKEAFQDHEVERQTAAIRALRDMEIEQLRTMLRLLHSYFNKEQLQVPVLQFFKENLPNLSIAEMAKDGQYEVKWKDRDANVSLNHADERTLHASLLRRLSIAYPDYSAGIHSLGGFEFSNKSGIRILLWREYLPTVPIFTMHFKSCHLLIFMPVKTGLLCADKLQIRSLVCPSTEI